MLWGRSKAVDVFLGRSRLGIQRQREPLHWGRGESAAELWFDALELIRTDQRVSVRVWLSGSLARPFLLPAVEGLRTLADAKMVAAARAPEETGLEGPCRVSIDKWRPGVPSTCVALEESLWSTISANHDPKRTRVIGVRPWWAAVLCDSDTDAKSLSVLTVDDGESLVALAGVGNQIDMVSTYVPALDAVQRNAMTQRVMLAAEGLNGARRHVRLVPTSQKPSPPLGRTQCPFVPVWEPAQ